MLFGTSALGRLLFPALLPQIFELLGTVDIFEASVLSFLHGSARQLHLVTFFSQMRNDRSCSATFANLLRY